MGPKFRAFSSLSHHRFCFCVSLGVLSWNFGGVFEAPELSNVHVWSSRAVVCEPRRPGLVGHGGPGQHGVSDKLVVTVVEFDDEDSDGEKER